MAYHYTLWHFAYIKPGTGGFGAATRDIELMHTILCVQCTLCVCNGHDSKNSPIYLTGLDRGGGKGIEVCGD